MLAYFEVGVSQTDVKPNVSRKGVTLTNKPGLYEMAMPDDDQHTLKLLKVKSSDVGEMTFVATNEFGSDSCSFSVETAGRGDAPLSIRPSAGFLTETLSTAAPTFETIMEDLDVCSGETPRFAVVVEGKPVPDILWFKVLIPSVSWKLSL